MGTAFIKLNENDTLAFGNIENGEFYSDKNNFHCWIETEKNIIDLGKIITINPIRNNITGSW